MSNQRERRPEQFRRILIPFGSATPAVSVSSRTDAVIDAPPGASSVRSRRTLSYLERALRRIGVASAPH